MGESAPDIENLELLDRRSPIRTGAVAFAGALVVFAVEFAGLSWGRAEIVGASAYVLRFAVPMLLVYFLSGCRCGDGPFYLTTGGLMGAIGALVGGGVALVLQSMVLGESWNVGAYFATMGLYVFLTALGAASLSGRYHSQSREIVWGDEYGSEIGRTAVEKFMARARPTPAGAGGKKGRSRGGRGAK